MNVVVNHLPIRPDADWKEMAAKADGFFREVMAKEPKVRAALLTRAGDAEAIVVIVYEDAATMHHISGEVAAPWFAENIRPYLSAPVSRSTGEVIAGTLRS